MSIRELAIPVVEDEPLIAMDIIVALDACGARVAGPVRSCGGADRRLDDASTLPPRDMVVLDHRVVDATSDEPARRFMDTGIPVVLHTASSQAPRPLADEPRVPPVPNPASGDDLVTAIRTLANPQAPAGRPKTSQPGILRHTH